MKRAIIYCRVSTDEQASNGTSLDAQEREALAYAQRVGLDVVQVFREDYSGATLDRPKLDRARAMLHAGQAEAFVTYKTDRQDRSEWGVNYLLFLQELKTLGVQFHKVDEARQVNLHDDYEMMMEGFKGWAAGKDRKDTVAKLRKGRYDRAKEGYVIPHGNVPFGYEVVKDDTGRHTFEINEAEAGAVRLIFEWYTGDKRLSGYAIAKRLTKLGVPTREGRAWNPSTVWRILDNETYVGTWHYGKSVHGRIMNPRENWVDVPVPVIVEPATWQVAQERREQNKRNSPRRTRMPYLLNYRLTCGHCRRKISAGYRKSGKAQKKILYYTCRSRYSANPCDCPLPTFRAELVDAIVWDWLESLLTDKLYRDQAIREYREQAANQTAPILAELATVEATEAQLRPRLENLAKATELVTEGEALEALAGRMKKINGQLEQLVRQREELTTKLEAAALTDAQINSIDRLAEESAQGLDIARKDFACRRRLVEILDVTGVLTFQDGKRYIDATVVLGKVKKRLSYDLTSPLS